MANKIFRRAPIKSANFIILHPREFIKYGDNLNPIDTKNLIIIKARLNNKYIQILIDTGSEVSLINNKIVQELKMDHLTFKMPKVILVGANKKKLCEVNKGIIGKIVFIEKEYLINFVIVDNINYDIVLGNDELDRQGILIDYLNGHLQIGKEVIKFKKEIIDNRITIKENDNMNKNICNMNSEIEVKNILNMQNVHDNNDIVCKEERRGDIINLLNRYKNLITEENQVTNKYVHKLEMRGIENFRSKSYPIPYKYRKEVNTEIQNMLKNNIIERCNSRFVNPIVVVKKN